MKQKILKVNAVAGSSAATQAAGSSAANTQPQETEEQKALRLASAVTDNGRITDKVNNTTAQAATSEPQDDLAIYINDMRNRRKKRSAPMAQNQGVLGQPTTLGV